MPSKLSSTDFHRQSGAVTKLTIPADYAERVYAGVLGKIIGVYLGRPFEGWHNRAIEEKLGEIQLSQPWNTGVSRRVQTKSPRRLSGTCLAMGSVHTLVNGSHVSLESAAIPLRSGSKKKADSLPPLETTLVPAQKGDSLEADELWSFVARKSDKSWIWLVTSFRTRQVVAAAVGDRSAETCRTLWSRVPKAYRRKLVYWFTRASWFTRTTDFYEAYFSALPKGQHRPRQKGSGKTNTVERFNNTLRQRLGCFVRKTLSFSKTKRMHGCTDARLQPILH